MQVGGNPCERPTREPSQFFFYLYHLDDNTRKDQRSAYHYLTAVQLNTAHDFDGMILMMP
jgi:hypothetical protein